MSEHKIRCMLSICVDQKPVLQTASTTKSHWEWTDAQRFSLHGETTKNYVLYLIRPLISAQCMQAAVRCPITKWICSACLTQKYIHCSLRLSIRCMFSQRHQTTNFRTNYPDQSHAALPWSHYRGIESMYFWWYSFSRMSSDLYHSTIPPPTWWNSWLLSWTRCDIKPLSSMQWWTRCPSLLRMHGRTRSNSSMVSLFGIISWPLPASWSWIKATKTRKLLCSLMKWT